MEEVEPSKEIFLTEVPHRRQGPAYRKPEPGADAAGIGPPPDTARGEPGPQPEAGRDTVAAGGCEAFPVVPSVMSLLSRSRVMPIPESEAPPQCASVAEDAWRLHES